MKECLMQYHNMLDNEAYKKIRQCGVDVFSIKTDAYVLRSSDLEKAHELIEFDNGFGTWRTMKSKMNH